MEAKVDVRKLQVLNDRINQTIDALNQVRLSVHGVQGLGHTGIPQPGFMSQGFGFPQTQGWGQQGFTGGLGHTGGAPQQLHPLAYLTQGQYGQGFGQGQFGQGLFGQGGYGQGGYGQGGPGFGQSGFQNVPGLGGIGLQHSGTGSQPNPMVNPQVLQQMGLGGMGGGIGNEVPFQSGPHTIEQKLVEARASDPYRISQTFPFAVI